MSDTYEHLIDNHFRGLLTAQEQEEWERLQSEPAFQKELLFRQQFHKAVNTVGRNELKKRLQALESNQTTAPMRPQIIRQWWFWSGVAALILVGWWGLRYLTTQPTFSEQLVAEVLEPYPNIVAPVHRGQPIDTSYTQAFQYYENGAYQEAIRLFKALPISPERDFYLAQSYLMRREIAEAMPLLKALRQQDSRFQQPTQWYESLSYLALNNTDEAIVALKKIEATNAHPYQTKASILLRKLSHK